MCIHVYVDKEEEGRRSEQGSQVTITNWTSLRVGSGIQKHRVMAPVSPCQVQALSLSFSVSVCLSLGSYFVLFSKVTGGSNVTIHPDWPPVKIHFPKWQVLLSPGESLLMLDQGTLCWELQISARPHVKDTENRVQERGKANPGLVIVA